MSNYEHFDDDRSGRFDWSLWRRVLAHARPYRRALAGLAAAGLAMAVSDSVLPMLTGRIIDAATGTGETGGVGSLPGRLIAFAAVGLSIGVLVRIFIQLAGIVATGYAYDLRTVAFDRLQSLSFSFYDKRPVGWLMARLTSDCDRLSSVIPWTMLDVVWGISLVIGISVQMLLLHWQLALLVMAIVPPLALVSGVFQKRLLGTQRLVRKTNSEITAGFNEAIMGVRTTKSLVRETPNLHEFQLLSTRMFDYSVRNALHSAVYLPLVMTLGSIGVGLSLWHGGVRLGDELTLGTLIAFMQYAALFSMPIQDLAARFTQMQAAQASAERIQRLLDTQPEIVDSPEVLQAMALAVRDGAATLDGGENEIREVEFANVGFAYKPEEPVLRDFDLRIRKGQTVALVGATGSGKSTVASLLARFYEPTSGSVRVNGQDLRTRSLEWYQSNFGIVLQSPHLFSGSVAENIRYGRLEATRAEIEEAARLANAHEFIAELEEGYDTEVGEGGNRLSTGQRQLISLARAILADPQIFIMDEATSSVDTETERAIQKGIERVLGGRISVVIAHRLSTIRSADRILVLDHGRVVEQGTHAELLARRGAYHRLYTRQFTQESIDYDGETAGGQAWTMETHPA